MDLPSAMVFDIDGVLADARHRLSFVASIPKNWDGFFAAAPGDPGLPEGIKMAEQALIDGHQIIYVTGRPERCRLDTLAWLDKHGLPTGPVHMRGDADRRPARYTKLATCRRLSNKLRIVAFVDDDAAVVETLRAAGFNVIHALWMQPSTSSTGSDTGVTELLFEVQEREGRS